MESERDIIFLRERIKREARLAGIRGNRAVKRGDPQAAIDAYREAIDRVQQEETVGEIWQGVFRPILERLGGDVFVSEPSELPMPRSRIDARQATEKRQAVDLSEEQEMLLLASLQPNEGRTNWANPRLSDVIRVVYADRLPQGSDEQTLLEASRRYRSAAINSLQDALQKIREGMYGQKTQVFPHMEIFIEWLRSQPEFAELTAGELEMLIDRDISFPALLPHLSSSADIPVTREIERNVHANRVSETPDRNAGAKKDRPEKRKPSDLGRRQEALLRAAFAGQ